ncbi:MAG: ribonuclease P protein component [Propionibacteriaceae bacterium]|nr:ribonuclease P protein component [Propionibacteriaceae bacterium]
MLSAVNRLRLTAEFRSVVHSHIRVGRHTLVIYAAVDNKSPSQIGFIVSKAVGGAVTRNRVKRQLRHLVRNELSVADPCAHIVVRALWAAANENEKLANDLHTAWKQVVRRLEKANNTVSMKNVGVAL